MATGTDQTLGAPRVLLIGASSQVGVFVIPRLLQAGFHVMAVSRKGRPSWCPASEQLEWLNENNAIRAAQACDYMLSAGPLEVAEKFLEAGRQFQSVVVFSSSSVETKQASGNRAERNQIQTMLALESEIQSKADIQGSKLVILRPTMIYGCGLDTNVSRLANWISRFGFVPVNGSAGGMRQPVHADDLASVAVSAMLSKHALPAVLALTGGETLPYSDMVGRIFTALEQPARLLRLPEWLFVLMVRMAGVFRLGGGINTEMVRRQRVDLVFDDQPARKFLNYKPRSFNPVATEFAPPEF